MALCAFGADIGRAGRFSLDVADSVECGGRHAGRGNILEIRHATILLDFGQIPGQINCGLCGVT